MSPYEKCTKHPWEAPKSAEDDPNAPLRVAQILSHPNYRQADNDADFLRLGEVRGIRLQLDYLKPELLLEQHGITSTIVVFGSARTLEPKRAQKGYNEAKEAYAHNPNDETAKALASAQKALDASGDYEIAREFGRIVGRSGSGAEDCRLTLMTGGGPGIMEAANRGAYDVGAKSIGLNISLPYEQYPNPYITPELCFCVHYFAMRKLHFLSRAKALVAFAGGFGTLDELFETLCLIQTGKIAPVPVILIGRAFWEKMIDFDFLVESGMIHASDLALFSYAHSANEAWEQIVAWYEDRGGLFD